MSEGKNVALGCVVALGVLALQAAMLAGAVWLVVVVAKWAMGHA